MRALISIGAVLLAGCLGPVTSEEAAQLNIEQVCVRYGEAVRRGSMDQVAVLQRDISRRGVTMAPADDDLIRAKQVRVGASRCLMYASWGASTRENRTTTSSGTRIQHVFGSSGSRNYVYTENGRITAVQN